MSRVGSHPSTTRDRRKHLCGSTVAVTTEAKLASTRGVARASLPASGKLKRKRSDEKRQTVRVPRVPSSPGPFGPESCCWRPGPVPSRSRPGPRSRRSASTCSFRCLPLAAVKGASPRCIAFCRVLPRSVPLWKEYQKSSLQLPSQNWFWSALTEVRAWSAPVAFGSGQGFSGRRSGIHRELLEPLGWPTASGRPRLERLHRLPKP